jgi:hypothetical protein
MIELCYPLVNVYSLQTGKSPFLIGKSAINGPFSIAMLNDQRVTNGEYGDASHEYS